MEKNTSLMALEALDISVLIKRMSNPNAFDLVINLIKMSKDVTIELQEYYEYLWGEYGNDEPWEKETEKHRPHHTSINMLQKRLLTFIMLDICSCKEIPSQIKEDTMIDIKSLVFEMSSYDAVPFLNSLIEDVEGKIDSIEMRDVHGEEITDELEYDMKELISLRDKMRAIVTEESEREKQWKSGVDMIEEEIAKENQEMIDILNQKETEVIIGNDDSNRKGVVVTPVTIAG